MADGAEGLSGIERRLDSLATAIMKQTEQVAGMSAEMKSFMNKELAAKQRLEIRDETQSQIKEASDALEQKAAIARALADKDTLDAARLYTDQQVAALVEELAGREERDRKMEARIRASIWGVIGVGTLGIAFALYELLAQGAH